MRLLLFPPLSEIPAKISTLGGRLLKIRSKSSIYMAAAGQLACRLCSLAVFASLTTVLGAAARRLQPSDLTIVTHLHSAAEGTFGPHAVGINQVGFAFRCV